jgi:pyruvyltransferase
MTIYLKQFSEVPNVGDVLGATIVRAIANRPVVTIGEASCDRPNLIALGSIAHWADERSVLWGCGLINDWIEPRANPAAVLALRGRLTRDRLTARGIVCPDVLGDVGLLLPRFVPPALTRRHRVGIVPHYADRESAFVAECRQLGIPIVDSLGDPDRYVELLTSCQLILSSSLHGIVFAHAYGIPAAWVQISQEVHGHGFKFFDYYSSLDVRRQDVLACDPRVDSLERMIAQCWLPECLPDTAALHAALLDNLAKVLSA